METGEFQTARRAGFIFHGRAGEYFGIWIVNLVLTVITLGIYSAWAKVRRLRYFYGNTELDGHRFDYHAKGWRILVGRIIVLVVLALLQGAHLIFPPAQIATSLILIFLLPWVINRSLRFQLRNTSYRNVRFDFEGKYWSALLNLLVWPLLTPLTLFVLWPFASKRYYGYILANARYGARPLAMTATTGAFYRKMIPLLLISFLLIVSLVAIVTFVVLQQGVYEATEEQVMPVLTGSIIVVYLAIILIAVASAIITRNLALSHAVIDDRHRVSSSIPVWSYLGVVLSNALVTVLTVGLMRPWAAVRMAQLYARHTSVDLVGDLDGYVSTLAETPGVIALALAEDSGFDLGIGV